jgi:antitoxin HigA-1
MIQSFRDKRTKRLFDGKRVPEFQAFARQAEKRLRVLDAADTIEALMMMPSNHFKALTGQRQGEYVSNGAQPAQRILRLLITNRRKRSTMAREPIHPGEILADELEELGISAAELARKIKVPPNRISQILSGKRSITADTALRLGKWLGTGPKIWLNLQQSYDLDLAKLHLGQDLEGITPREAA